MIPSVCFSNGKFFGDALGGSEKRLQEKKAVLLNTKTGPK